MYNYNRRISREGDIGMMTKWGAEAEFTMD